MIPSNGQSNKVLAVNPQQQTHELKHQTSLKTMTVATNNTSERTPTQGSTPTNAAAMGAANGSGGPESNTMSLPSVLKHVDNYIVFNEKLGGGQFSQVYKAMDKNDKTHQKYFAVKVIPMSSAQYQKFANYNQLLQKEIEILLKARHDNLLCMHDLKQTPNNLYLFLDYCNGGDLRQLLVKKNNRLAEEEAVEYFKQMCAGYQALHDKMVIHRDLKPENILLHDNQIKIGDFGFARIVNDLDEAIRMTQKCSPLYAPPQILQNQKYSSKCDVWSMGCIFFEMLYGKPPFNAHSIISLTENIKKLVGTSRYVLPSFPPVAQEAKDILQRMLMYSEKDRISWDEIFKHPILVKHLQKKLVENVAVEPNISPLYQSIRKNIDAVWDNRANPPTQVQPPQIPLFSPISTTTQQKFAPQPQPPPPPQQQLQQQPPSTPQPPLLPQQNMEKSPSRRYTATTQLIPQQQHNNPNSPTKTQPPVLARTFTNNEPHSFHRHERRFSQTSQTVLATATTQSQRQTRATVADRSPSPISRQPQTLKRAYSNNAREQMYPFPVQKVNIENPHIQQQQQHIQQNGSSRQSPSTKQVTHEEKRKEVYPVSPNNRQATVPSTGGVTRHYTQHTQATEELTQQQQHPFSSSRRETHSFREQPSRSPVRLSPISSPLTKPTLSPAVTQTTIPNTHPDIITTQQLLDKYSSQNSNQQQKLQSNALHPWQQQQDQQQQTQAIQMYSSNPKEASTYNYTSSYPQQKENIQLTREDSAPLTPKQGVAPSPSSQAAQNLQKDVIQKIEQSKELSENEKYVLYMKQIKVREAERSFVSKIDAFFSFMRKRALFANATLLNFWNSTRQLNLPSYLQCAILYCLCSYYYFALEQLRKILAKEIEQKVIKKDGFEVYQRSTEYQATKDQITQDVSEAKQLFTDIEPFMISEIKLSTTPDAVDFVRFITSKHSKHDDFRVKLQSIFCKAIQYLNTSGLDKSAAKGVHMVQIFANIEEFIPSKQYNEFDFNRFYDDRFNNLQLEQFIQAINKFNIKYFMSEKDKLN